MKTNRAATPDSFDAVQLGFVSDVKDQKQCGKEHCFLKLLHHKYYFLTSNQVHVLRLQIWPLLRLASRRKPEFLVSSLKLRSGDISDPGDYSEQQLLDCGYAKNGAAGCNGAWPHSYIKTVVDEQMDLAAEVNFDKLIHSKFF